MRKAVSERPGRSGDLQGVRARLAESAAGRHRLLRPAVSGVLGSQPDQSCHQRSSAARPTRKRERERVQQLRDEHGVPVAVEADAEADGAHDDVQSAVQGVQVAIGQHRVQHRVRPRQAAHQLAQRTLLHLFQSPEEAPAESVPEPVVLVTHTPKSRLSLSNGQSPAALVERRQDVQVVDVVTAKAEKKVGHQWGSISLHHPDYSVSNV